MTYKKLLFLIAGMGSSAKYGMVFVFIFYYLLDSLAL